MLPPPPSAGSSPRAGPQGFPSSHRRDNNAVRTPASGDGGSPERLYGQSQRQHEGASPQQPGHGDPGPAVDRGQARLLDHGHEHHAAGGGEDHEVADAQLVVGADEDRQHPRAEGRECDDVHGADHRQPRGLTCGGGARMSPCHLPPPRGRGATGAARRRLRRTGWDPAQRHGSREGAEGVGVDRGDARQPGHRAVVGQQRAARADQQVDDRRRGDAGAAQSRPRQPAGYQPGADASPPAAAAQAHTAKEVSEPSPSAATATTNPTRRTPSQLSWADTAEKLRCPLA